MTLPADTCGRMCKRLGLLQRLLPGQQVRDLNGDGHSLVLTYV
jgi:hypothetical protein